jgi:hypothetical protein
MEEQPRKACSPMLVTLSGIVRVVKFFVSAYANKAAGMYSTLSPIMKEVIGL